MKTKPKAIGTNAETAVVKYVRENGFPNAERRALSGNSDVGDVLMCPGFILEVKGGATAERLEKADLDKWRDELRIECVNAAKTFGSKIPYHGMLVTKRRGYGPARASEWWAHFDAAQWVDEARLWGMFPMVPLRQAVFMARMTGFGTPLNLAGTNG